MKDSAELEEEKLRHVYRVTVCGETFFGSAGEDGCLRCDISGACVWPKEVVFRRYFDGLP